MGVKLNLTQSDIKKAKGIFEPLPLGVYGAVIFEAKDAISKSSGNPMYTVTYKVTELPEGATEGLGYKFTAYYSQTEKAWFKARELFKAIGRTDIIEGIESSELEFPPADEVLLGEEVNLKLKHDQYESVDDEDNEVTLTRAVADRVSPRDDAKLRLADAPAAEEETAAGGKFLGL